jgi:hypothetical protein
MSSNLDNDINFKNMYNYQAKGLITKNDNYDKYIKYLQFFFQKNHEKDKYSKEFMNGSYILVDKKDPKKKIEITPSRFINIHKFYLELKNQIDVILLKFFSFIESKDNFTNENREEFDVLKKKYSAYKEKIEEIDLINTDFYKETIRNDSVVFQGQFVALKKVMLSKRIHVNLGSQGGTFPIGVLSIIKIKHPCLTSENDSMFD